MGTTILTTSDCQVNNNINLNYTVRSLIESIINIFFEFFKNLYYS